MDPRRFLYRDNALDLDGAKRLAAKHLSAADDGELYLQYSASEAFGFDDGRLKTADYHTTSGFGLRGVSGETTAFAHANDISAAAIERAGETLKLLDPRTAQPAPAPARTNQAMYGGDDPLALIPFAKKVALCQQIDAAARARDPRVAQVAVSLSASWTVIDIIRADGFVASDIRPLVRLGVQIVAKDGSRRETGTHGLGGRYLYDRLFEEAEWGRAIDIALAQALTNLESVDAPAGEMPVVVGPGWPGVLLHEAVGHGLEGDFNRKGTSAFSGRIGERVAAPGVTVIDDGAIFDRRGSLTIDDEGTPTQRNVLIEDGILKGYIQDRLNARLMGVAPTGNGRRESFAHAPMPRMTNTFMLGGTDDPDELVSRVKDGIYAKSFGGGQVDITSGKFVFSCTEAYRIRGGKIAEPVKGATLIGDGPTVLTRVKGIGNDLALDEGVGVCGKGGQSVPAGVGQPTLLIEGLTVGGNGRLSDWIGDVVRFWFGQPDERWWKTDPAFDEEVRERFGALRDEKRRLPVDCFLGHPLTSLAAVVLFDQFPRNMFRGQAEQFATDHIALAVAKRAVAESLDDQLSPRERGVLYMPFQHSESPADQAHSLQLFTALGDDFQLGFARKHHDVVARFGRFPHRNAMLGRAPRPDEIAAGDVFPW